MTGDVRRQLTEALDEVERLARDAIQAATCGCHLLGADTSRWLWEGGDSVQVDNGTGHSVITGASWGSTFLDDRTGTWIARWDPATVLRLVERDRQLLADVVMVEEQRRENNIKLAEAWAPYGDRDVLPRLREHAERIGGRIDALQSEVDRAAAFWLGTPESDR